MIKRKVFLFIQLLVIGLLITTVNSCEKEAGPIVKKDAVITWASPADLPSGTALSATQLNATANIAGTFVYTPASGTVLSVGAAQNLKVDFTPTDAANYNSATKTVTINVIAADAAITWANPADIRIGTALSATQLNATANVAGTFVYTPASGTVLSVGADQNLKVDFTPTDAANYNTATKTVTINVIPKTDPVITWANPADITSGTALSATQLNATADVAGTFVYTPARGTVLSVGADQNLKVDFTPADAVNYNTATKTVTINVTGSFSIGDSYEGGKIAYIFVSGDPGYVEGETHGLIAANEDQSSGIVWAIAAYQSTRVEGTLAALGSGLANTDKIIAQNGAGTTYAAGLARAYTGGNYTDWYLPSKDELDKLFDNRVAIGGFAASYPNYYWSSYQFTQGFNAWCEAFTLGQMQYGNKTSLYRVRAVRSF